MAGRDRMPWREREDAVQSPAIAPLQLAHAVGVEQGLQAAVGAVALQAPLEQLDVAGAVGPGRGKGQVDGYVRLAAAGLAQLAAATEAGQARLDHPAVLDQRIEAAVAQLAQVEV